MASERRVCQNAACKRRFSRPLGSRRVFCESCRPPRDRRPATVRAAEAAAAAEAERGPGPGEIEVATVAALATVGEDPLAGQARAVALKLARVLDTLPATSAQFRTTAAALRDATESALRGAPKVKDELDLIAEEMATVLRRSG